MFREVATIIGYLAYAVYILGFFGMIIGMILLGYGYAL